MERKAIPTTSVTSQSPTANDEPGLFPIEGPSALSPTERRVLDALGEASAMTAGELRRRTGLTTAELGPALESLRAKGVVARLNTVVESYRARFPGVSLDAEAGSC